MEDPFASPHLGKKQGNPPNEQGFRAPSEPSERRGIGVAQTVFLVNRVFVPAKKGPL